MKSKKGLGYFWILMIFMALIIGLMVQKIPNFNVDDFKEKLNWTNIDLDVESIQNQPDLVSGLESFINGLGEAAFHFMKWMAQWSSEHPETPFKLLLIFLIVSISAPILLVLFKFSVILFIILREWYVSSKEKRILIKRKWRKK